MKYVLFASFFPNLARQEKEDEYERGSCMITAFFPPSQMWARSSDHIETDESMDTHHQSSNTHVLQLHSSVILFPSTKCRLHLNQGVMVINYSSEFSGKLKETGGGADAWEATPAAHR